VQPGAHRAQVVEIEVLFLVARYLFAIAAERRKAGNGTVPRAFELEPRVMLPLFARAAPTLARAWVGKSGQRTEQRSTVINNDCEHFQALSEGMLIISIPSAGGEQETGPTHEQRNRSDWRELRHRTRTAANRFGEIAQ
jgi:hypothetical protein